MTPVLWAVLLLGVTAILYAGTTFAYYFTGRPGMAVTFIGYVIANIGLIWDLFQQGAK